MKHKPTLPPSFLRPKDACAFLGVSRGKLYVMSELDPTFPKKITISTRCVGWRREALEAWLLKKEQEAGR